MMFCTLHLGGPLRHQEGVCRRVVAEGLQNEATVRGQAAATSMGASATVDAAAASESLQAKASA